MTALKPNGLTVFLGVLLVVMAAYTQLAMGMEWRTQAGRIGPGFFPRIVGLAAIVLLVVAAVRSLRAVPDTEEQDAPLGHHPKALLRFTGAAVVFVALLAPLGAILAAAVFLLATLTLLDRDRLRRNVAIAVALPVAMYLLFQVGLNAGLPSGILPLR